MRLILLVVIGFAAGLAAAFIPGIKPFMDVAVPVAMIVAGLVLASPLATSRPADEPQRQARRRLTVLGAVFVLQGASHFVPSDTIRIGLYAVVLVLLAVLAVGWRRAGARAGS